MRKVIAAINITIDGFCNHEYGIADDETHNHYTQLLHEAGILLYGRKTFELMKFWPTLLEKPSDNKAMNDFAIIMDRVPKLIFSNTLKDTGWKTATLATKSPEEEVMELKKQPGKDIFIGSPSLIDHLTSLNLIDEFQLCIHPVIAGKGLPLFKNLNDLVNLTLVKTKTFTCGAVIHYYERK